MSAPADPRPEREHEGLLDQPANPPGHHGPGHAAYPALDGLRALAVLAVVVTHSAFVTGRYERGWGNNALARLDCGVAVFFVLSGFLLVRPWLSAAVHGTPSPSVRTYAVRRVARIMPAYLLAVVLAMTLLSENHGSSVWDWVRHVFLLQIYQLGWLRHGLTQTWSLSTEVAFYALLPLVGLLLVRLSRRRWRPGLLVAVLAVGILVPVPWYFLLHHSSGDVWLTAGFWLPGYAGWFAAGMIIAVIRVHLDARGPTPGSPWWFAEELGRSPLTCWTLAVLAYFIALTPVAGPRSFVATTTAQAVTKQGLYLVMAVGLIWPLVFGRSTLAATVFANPVMRYLGDISYGVFLYHLIVLDGVMNLLGNVLWTGRIVTVLPLTLLGAGLVAAVSFAYLEKPFIRAAHRRRLAPPPTADPPTRTVPAASR